MSGATTATYLAYASIAATVASGVMSYVGQQQAGKAQASALNYQAQVDQNNSIIQERQAQDALERGREEERLHRIKIGQLKSTQINAFAKNGVEVDSGSALDVLSDTAMFGELESQQIRNNADREAYAYRVGAMNYSNSAANNTLAASNARTSANNSAYATVLGTAGSVAGKWYDYKKAGSV